MLASTEVPKTLALQPVVACFDLQAVLDGPGDGLSDGDAGEDESTGYGNCGQGADERLFDAATDRVSHSLADAASR
jgi:hypothetical protein